ncbi:hypothetical protein [Corynebacterium tapiri]|uniref:Uncharacterized protein n=1 Tax=Corynebacterium tapiri TaxID=1448266 RepID=A0A5C4U326_9CORY|nr:hypothetical protein [Corynebacterium tapiri]TNL95077.1 hypothetical protein FHE74_09840 [Corynebacterium tapiri]
MSTLVVFSDAPTDTIADFLHWLDLTTEWVEDRDYSSTEGTDPALAAWFEEMSARFPSRVDGPSNTTRYIIASTCIYARFAEREWESACALARALATEHNLGFYESGSGEVHLADGRCVS